jgi:uncharacterized protein YqeY
MSLLEKLKDRSLEYRKQHHHLGTFLSGVLSDAHAFAKSETKNGISPDITDEHALRAIKTGIKQQDDVIKLVAQESEAYNNALEKKQFLQDLLPPVPSEESLRAAIDEFFTTHDRSKTSIGPAIRAMTDKFGIGIDRGIISKLIQEYINK